MKTRVGLVVTSVLAGVLGIGAARPHPSRAASGRSDLARRSSTSRACPERGRSSRASSTRFSGREVLIITGRFGFKTLDVSDPSQAAGARHVPAARDPRRERLLAGRGHGHRRPPQPDHRGARPPSRQRRPGELPRHRHARLEEPEPWLPLRLLRHLVRDPENLTPGRRASSTCPRATRSSCIDGCNYVWAGGPARRDDQADLGPFTPGGRGDGRPIWVTDLRNPAQPKVFPEPIDLWRNDGLTDYSHDVDVDDNGIAWTSGRGGLLGYATQGKWRDPRTDKVRNARPWDPILVAGGGIEGGPDGVAQPQTDFIHNAARPLDGKVRATGVPDGQRRPDDRGGLHRAVQPERSHRRRRHHRLARRRAGDRTPRRHSRTG